MSPDSLASNAPPGYNTPAVTSAPHVATTVAPTDTDATIALKTTVLADDSIENITKPAPVIIDPALSVMPLPISSDMPPSLEHLKQSSEDVLLEPDPPYLQLNLRVPCAKDNPSLYAVGTTHLLFSHIYNASDGLSPAFPRLIRSMITEILFTPDTQFNYIAVDTFSEHFISSTFFGDFVLSTGRNRPLRDADLMGAYLQRAQAYFDTPAAAGTDRYTSINVDIPDALIIEGCNYEASPYYNYVQSLIATQRSTAQSTIIDAHPSETTNTTTTQISTVTPSPPSTTFDFTIASVSTDAAPGTTMVPPQTPTTSPATTGIFNYSNNHQPDMTEPNDTTMGMDYTQDTPLGQLFMTSIKEISSASIRGIAYGTDAAVNQLRRGLHGVNQSLRTDRKQHVHPPSSFRPVNLYPPATNTGHRASPTVTFHPTPTVVHIPPCVPAQHNHSVPPNTTPGPIGTTSVPPYTSTTQSTTPSGHGNFVPTLPSTPHSNYTAFATGPDNGSGFHWRNRSVMPHWQHSHSTSDQGVLPESTESGTSSSPSPSPSPTPPGFLHDHRSYTHRDSRSPSHGQRPLTYGTSNSTGANPYVSARSTHRNMTPNYTMLTGAVMDMDSYLNVLLLEPHIGNFTKGSNIPIFTKGDSIAMWYRRFVMHGASHGVYIPPYETVHTSSPLGDWFEHLPLPLRMSHSTFSSAISAALTREGIFPTGSTQQLIVSTMADGYMALHTLLRSIHPRLHGLGSQQQPEQRDNEPFLEYVVRVKDYAYDELVLGNCISDHALIGLVIRNVHRRYKFAVNTHVDTKYRLLDPGDDIPFEMHIDQIALTMHAATTLHTFPRADTSSSYPPRNNTSHDYPIHTLNRTAQRIQWHNRLGHIHSRRIAELHKCAIGVPNLPIANDLEQCPTCLLAKTRRTARSTTDSRHATVPNQGLSVDFGFIVQRSNDSKRYHRYQGIQGQTCYILIADHFSGMLYGHTFKNKAPPIQWLNEWLAIHSPPCLDKYVRMDQGGDLAKCREITTIFRNAGYQIEITGAGNSAQNGPVERPHQTIAEGIRALLYGADLEPTFWPYAFQHFLRLSNMMPHAGHKTTPYEILYSRPPDLSRLRTFGCRVYVRPPGDRPAKLAPHVDRGIFLGYQQTFQNIIYYDLATKQIKINTHARFDEGMNDLATLPPNAEYLLRQQGHAIHPEAEPTPSFGLDSTPNPFSILADETIPIVCDHATFGFTLTTCQNRRRVFVSSLERGTTALGIRNGRRRYTGAFLVAINNIPVFSMDDAIHAFTAARQDPQTTELTVTLSPERQPALRDLREPYVFGIDQLRAVANIHYGSGDSDILADISDDDLSLLVASLQSTTSSEALAAERALGTLTRKKLLNLASWPEWERAIDEQLDNMAKQNMYGPPCKPPPDSVVLRQHWTYLIKPDGRRKPRNCCDGSKRAAPQLQIAANTYSSCAEQPTTRMFWALAAAEGMTVHFCDATNAYENSPGPKYPTYVRIDDAYAAWYKRRFGIQLDRSLVLPVQHALQGHPEAGALWERFVNSLLTKLGFVATTQERSLYRATIQGKVVLLCRQVDDMAIACVDPSICQWVISQLANDIDLVDGGIVKMFNGVDVTQTREYIMVSCESYIRRMLTKHGWDSAKPNESDTENLDPLPDTLARAIDAATGPADNTPEAAALVNKHGFTYRSVLGELIYAYVAGRLDIGYAIAALSRHASHPADVHYTGLIRVCTYLRKTIRRGIIYWRPTPVPTLPPGTHSPIDCTTQNIPSFPLAISPTTLTGYVDAAYGTDSTTRRSVTGLAFTFCGGAVAYRSKLQPIVATSSTEAEFIAAVQAAKMAKYLRSVLHDLGYTQSTPTPIYSDNEAAILMTNANKPTQRSRHIDIQWYAIQECMQRGDIILRHIAGIINPADSLTKALGWILHLRHVRRLMGHHYPLYTSIEHLPDIPNDPP
jgi:Reverse transcriptase (RNA-dependent DNA polymerase)/GAG-pre-integrase domain